MEQPLLDIYKFLVNLRNSGTTNMYGAAPYVEDTFNLSQLEAKDALLGWMETFKLPRDKQPADGR